MVELGIQEAKHKACGPTTQLVWLGLIYDSEGMTISIPQQKLEEIMTLLGEWEGKQRATLKELQSLIGTLQFVAGVSPPTPVFTNRMLATLRESLSWGFKWDLAFFLALLPHYNGIKIIDKEDIEYQDELELDACLTGCDACTGKQYYSERFPGHVIQAGHPIAHLELMNIVVALKVWQDQWAGHKVKVECDNSNACMVVTLGQSRDPYMQHCVREVFLLTAAYDIDLRVVHRPGAEMDRADALSRAHTASQYREWIRNDPVLSGALRVRMPDRYFVMDNKL